MRGKDLISRVHLADKWNGRTSLSHYPRKSVSFCFLLNGCGVVCKIRVLFSLASPVSSHASFTTFMPSHTTALPTNAVPWGSLLLVPPASSVRFFTVKRTHSSYCKQLSGSHTKRIKESGSATTQPAWHGDHPENCFCGGVTAAATAQQGHRAARAARPSASLAHCTSRASQAQPCPGPRGWKSHVWG